LISKKRESQQMYWLSLFILVSMNDGPCQPKAITYGKYTYYSEGLAQALFGMTGNTKIHYNRAHAEHGMGGYDDQE